MADRMPEARVERPVAPPLGADHARSSRLLDRDVSWLAPTVDLLRATLPAGSGHPLFVPIAAYQGRALLDRVLLLAYLQRAEATFPGRLGDPDPAEVVAWVTKMLRPAEQGFLGRCLTAATKYGRIDELLASMATAFGMQTCRIVAARVAGPRFGLSRGASLIQDLAVEMSARCLPVPAGLRRRRNARDGYFVTYTPDKTFAAYLDRSFQSGELEGVLKNYGRARAADGRPQEIVLPDLLDDEIPDDTETIRSDQRRVRERLAPFEPPAKVWRHFEHPTDGRTRSCCAAATRWITETRARLASPPT